MLDYEKTKTHFVTVIAKVIGAWKLNKCVFCAAENQNRHTLKVKVAGTLCTIVPSSDEYKLSWKVNLILILLLSKDGGGNFNGKEQFMSSSATLTINVIDVQDTPPSFIGTPYFGYVYEISVPVSMKQPSVKKHQKTDIINSDHSALIVDISQSS